MKELKIEITNEIAVGEGGSTLSQRVATINLDKECLSCVHNESPCPFCDDVGFIPTDAGKEILELVKRYK